MGQEVLLLNTNYEPLNVCTLRRAMALVLLGKAEVLEHREAKLRTAERLLDAPSVLKIEP